MSRLVIFILCSLVFFVGSPNDAKAANPKMTQQQWLMFEEPRFELALTSHSFSNIVPVSQLFKDEWKEQPQSRADQAFSQNSMSLAYQAKHYHIGVAKRLDYFLSTTKQTSDAYYFIEQQQAPHRERFPVSLQMEQLQATGVFGGYTFGDDQFRVTVDVGLWSLDALRRSRLSGEVELNLNDEINGQLHLDEVYSHNNLLKRPNNDDWQERGKGVTTDISFFWNPLSPIDLTLSINDLYSKYKVNQLGFSQGRVSTDNVYVNDQGYQSFLPLYRGVELEKNVSYQLPKTVLFAAAYQGERFSYLLNAKVQGDLNFYEFGLSTALGIGNFSVLYDMKYQTPTIMYQTARWDLLLKANRLNIEQTMQLAIQLAFRW
ncbi:hypothetical protein [Psychrobium sp. 1_MG-2023]|uniref:hypothetical protein n=1 Tax=Psychrobium sp. 1_MG-2023 TaxID=3062624 RepID=UPI00273657E0|nr:hypothetical protein [Psychrobium sp. 1_MG-2023]MDP2559797.1 hypothetical protein [Psychrobium sp. 1_MG-2023]